MNNYRKTLLIFLMVAAFLIASNLGLISNTEWFMPEVSNAKNTNGVRWQQKEFMLTMWNATEPGTADYAQIAREKYNVIPVNYNALPLNDSVERLEVAKKNGLKVILGNELINPANLHDVEKRKKLDSLIEKVKKYDSLEGYFIIDEPIARNLSKYVELVSYLRKKDPGRLIYMNILPHFAVNEGHGISVNRSGKKKLNYPSHLHGVGVDNKTVITYMAYLRQFVDTIKPDFISYDYYHLFEKKDGDEYFLNLALVSQVAKEAGKPFLNIIQAGRYLKEWRLPTEQEVRFQVYTTLAYGGRGISYFTYWGRASEEGLYRDGKPSALVKSVGAINSEIRNLGPTLMSLNSQGVYHTSPLPFGGEEIPSNSPVKILSKSEVVLGLFGKGKSTNTFLISNRNYRSRQKADIKVGIAGMRIQELNRKTGKWIPFKILSSARIISVNLEPGDGRLFRVM
jgi:hypothetical protein